MKSQRSRPPSRKTGPQPPRRGAQPGGMRKLPDAMTQLAAGDDRALRKRPASKRDRVRDTRDRVRISGTNNRDARAVYDARLRALQREIAADNWVTVGDGLLAMEQLGLYRARNIVNFQAFATSVLELSLDQAQMLLNEAAARVSRPLERLPEPLVALWIRTEAAMREHLGDMAVQLAGTPAESRLEFAVPCTNVGHAVAALAGVGRQAAGLAHHLDLPGAQRTPRGEGPESPGAESPATGGEPRRPLPRHSED